jgi:hypothetical protein
MAETVGRPKRAEEVTNILLRLPPALLVRCTRAQALLQLGAGTSVTRTAALVRLLELGCDAVEQMRSEIPKISERSQISNISEIKNMSDICEISEIPEISVDEAAAAWAEDEAAAGDGAVTSAPQTGIPEGERPAPQDTPAEEVPAYDQTKYILGKRCPRGHEWGTTGQTLRRMNDTHCPRCDREAKQRSLAKAKAQASQTEA